MGSFFMYIFLYWSWILWRSALFGAEILKSPPPPPPTPVLGSSKSPASINALFLCRCYQVTQPGQWWVNSHQAALLWAVRHTNPSTVSSILEASSFYWFILTHSETKTPKNIYSWAGEQQNQSILSSNWQHKFLYFHCKSVKLDICVDKINYENFVILSNLKSCQFAPRISATYYYCIICCQFEDLQFILCLK